MKFILLDRIVALELGERIVTVKSLSLAEEYLADHFPTFPVLPGVLMLEAMVQSASWLVRVSENFAHSMIVLEEARNISYKSFVAPGQTLQVSVEAMEIAEAHSEFKASGNRNGEEVVKARVRLRHYNLAAKEPDLADVDRALIVEARRRFTLLGGPTAMDKTLSTAV